MFESNLATPLGVGMVGLSASGGWAAGAHLPALAAVGGVELRAVSASSYETAANAAQMRGAARAYADVDELSASEDVDLVVVAVKMAHHAELAEAAVRHGKPVLREWPQAASQAEAMRLTFAAAAFRPFVGLPGRMSPTASFVRHLLDTGYVGEVLSTTLLASGDAWGSPITARQAYVLDGTNGATPLSIPFAHSIDVISHLLGELVELTAVSARRRRSVPELDGDDEIPLRTDDQLVVAGILDSVVVAAVHYRRGTSRAGNLTWDITGTHGEVRVESTSGSLQTGRLRVLGGRGRDLTLVPLTVRNRFDLLPELADSPAHALAHLYHRIRLDLLEDTHVAPDFTDGLCRHNLLQRITRAATAEHVRPSTP